ncbi:MAG: hypothetical protein Ct9H90mP2_07040 [Dehalococcoidia bacterium]|nr:MAG: hypothetical protein Ct9H90mP2_07040 [Dehalococcoidia bacterium]
MGIGGALFTHGKRFIDPIPFEPMLLHLLFGDVDGRW